MKYEKPTNKKLVIREDLLTKADKSMLHGICKRNDLSEKKFDDEYFWCADSKPVASGYLGLIKYLLDTKNLDLTKMQTAFLKSICLVTLPISSEKNDEHFKLVEQIYTGNKIGNEKLELQSKVYTEVEKLRKNVKNIKLKNMELSDLKKINSIFQKYQ